MREVKRRLATLEAGQTAYPGRPARSLTTAIFTTVIVAVDNDVARQLRETHARGLKRQAQRRAAVDGGRGPVAVMQARERAFQVAGDRLTDDARDYITTLVYEAYDKAEREAVSFDPLRSGEEVGRHVARVLDWQKKGGIAGMLERIRFPHIALDRASFGLDAARPIGAGERVEEPREPPVLESPFPAWRAETAERAERQIDALQSLVEHARSQSKYTMLGLGLSRIAAVSGVAAVVIALVH